MLRFVGVGYSGRQYLTQCDSFHRYILRGAKPGAACACLYVALLFAFSGEPLRANLAQNSASAVTKLGISAPAQTENLQPAPESEAANVPIPLPQIANRAELLDLSLLEVSRHLSSPEELRSIDQKIGKRNDQIRERLRALDRMIADGPTALELRDEGFYWDSLNSDCEEQRKFLTSRATKLDDQTRFLDAEKEDWQVTSDHIPQAAGLEAVKARVAQELSRIKAARDQIQEQLNHLLTLQNSVFQQKRQVAGAQTEVREASKELHEHLLERDGFPLWTAQELRDLERPKAGSIVEFWQQEFGGLEEYIRANVVFVSAILGLYVLAVVLIFRLRRYLSVATDSGVPSESLAVLARPFSIALLVVLRNCPACS
jgi:hypothetical protein